jgi:hypothetical protein
MLLLLLLAIALAAFAACGGGDDDEEGGGDNSEATATQAASSDDDTGDSEEPTDAAGPTDEPDDGDGGGDGAADSSEACSLLTKSEVEDAFGVSMLDPELIPLPDTPISGGALASVSSCSFVSSETTDSTSLTITSAPDGESAISEMIDLECENKDEISGLGDKACWYSEAHTEIQMRVGSTFVDLFVTTVTGDTTEIASALAEKVAGRLS